MLSNIWDVFGEPCLDVYECMAMEQFLDPVGDRRLCHVCLTELPSDHRHADQHQCLLLSHVRAKWPAMPPWLERRIEETRIEEARKAGSRGQTQPRAGRKWWQFWR